MNKVEIIEEIRYCWECFCGQINEECEEPESGDIVVCCDCSEESEIS